jgi:membrane-associated protein
MDLLHWFADFFLHLTKHLGEFILQYGAWTYALLFVIIFCETGLVFTPFLPGDSLLFAAGTFAAPNVQTGQQPLNLWSILLLLTIAAVVGDTVNYWIGKYLGPRIIRRRLLKQEHLDRTHAFFEKYGGKTIILARFVPIVRTFAPFVAGLGAMTYRKFIAYNVIGGVAWVLICTLGGYFFGQFEFVQKHFELVIIAIVIISVLPGVFEYLRHRRSKARELAAAEVTVQAAREPVGQAEQ